MQKNFDFFELRDFFGNVRSSLEAPSRIDFGPPKIVTPQPLPPSSVVFPNYTYAPPPVRGAKLKSTFPNG